MKVAIAGGGFSGTMAAVEVLRCVPGAHVTLIEKRRAFAQGAAYSTRSFSHLLNVRAKGMSAFADAPGHFADWAQAEGLGGPESFVPRREYRRYLEGVLAEAQAEAGERLRLIEDEAVAAEGGTLVLASGERLDFDVLVLAGGNYPGRLPAAGLEGVDDPWSAAGAAAIAALAGETRGVLLVGTGLTMVDVALALDDAGFRGRITALSRRGLVPRPHEEPGAPPLAWDPPARLSALLRQLRGAEGPWRPVVDGLRPRTVSLWQGFSDAEKSRFLRHLRPYWDVHRHRIAPDVAARIEALRSAGRLEVLAGRVSGVEGDEVTIALRGGRGEIVRSIATAINCTGPEGRIARVSDPLIRQLLADGRLRADALGLGLDVDDLSRAIGADGAPSPHLFALGPLTRGVSWEIVAVPDIRGQVRRVAEAIAAY
jgi:uncharacterized NAD(P)/FAD-binding protein YdhS